MPHITIIKRDGTRPTEQFSDAKLHGSIYAACLSVRTSEGEAHRIASDVLTTAKHWCQDHPEVTSHDLRRVATKHLSLFHPEAAYLYQHHRLVL